MSRRLLIVDDLATNRVLLKAKLAKSRHEVHLASSPSEARVMARQRAFDLILLDYQMPGMNGVELCRHLRADPASAKAALLMVTSHPDPAVRLQALRAGADDILAREVPATLLQARVRNLLAAADRDRGLREETRELERLSLAEPESGFEHRPVVGLIAGDGAVGLRWRNALMPYLDARYQILSRDSALSEPSPPPEVYLIAEDQDRGEPGHVLLSELRAHGGRSRAPVCLLTAPDAPERMVAALDMGAEDVATLGLDPAELALRLRRLIAQKRQMDQLQRRLTAGLRLALTDPLTGLSNRRFALPELAQLQGRNDEGAADRPLAAIVLDVDRFKQVNDRHGHAAGDAVLAAIAQRLRTCFPGAEILARLGGDEFLVVITATNEQEAEVLAERLRSEIARDPIQVPGLEEALMVTASIGVALSTPNGESGEGLLARADLALLAAKARGRDQIRLRRHSAA